MEEARGSRQAHGGVRDRRQDQKNEPLPAITQRYVIRDLAFAVGVVATLALGAF
jgi:hypothetical protein